MCDSDGSGLKSLVQVPLVSNCLSSCARTVSERNSLEHVALKFLAVIIFDIFMIHVGICIVGFRVLWTLLCLFVLPFLLLIEATLGCGLQ